MNPSRETGPLLRVCSLLNEAGAKYLVAGAYAMILNSIVRATEDVDILIEDSTENFRRVIEGLSSLADGAARELKPEDIAENVVVKIADEVEVDINTQKLGRSPIPRPSEMHRWLSSKACKFPIFRCRISSEANKHTGNRTGRMLNACGACCHKRRLRYNRKRTVNRFHLTKPLP